MSEGPSARTTGTSAEIMFKKAVRSVIKTTNLRIVNLDI
jgi:hypothetical protein